MSEFREAGLILLDSSCPEIGDALPEEIRLVGSGEPPYEFGLVLSNQGVSEMDSKGEQFSALPFVEVFHLQETGNHD